MAQITNTNLKDNSSLENNKDEENQIESLRLLVCFYNEFVGREAAI